MSRKFLLAFALAFTVSTCIMQNASAQTSLGSMSLTSPVMKDAQGTLLSSAPEGQFVVLSTTVTNTRGEAQPFVAIMEVRDQDGATQFPGFSIGNLEDNGTSEIGISWTPENAGDYQLRAFLISGFEDPEILTVAETSDAVIE